MSDPPQGVKRAFINSEGELRSGWRVLAFLFLFIAASGFANSLVYLLGLLPARQPGATVWGSYTSFGIDRLIALLAVVFATAVCARVLERRSFGSVGFMLHSGWERDSAWGALLGTATLSLAVAIPAAAGATSFSTGSQGLTDAAAWCLALLVFFLVAGAFEELLLRGFAFQALLHNIGPAATVTITSIAFGLLHLSNPNVTLISTVNTILAGVWLALAYLATRSLWLATALHVFWNFTTVFVFGLPVSGLSTFEQWAWFDGEARPPAWLSGGDYGPEGGAAATLALVVSTAFIWKSGLFRPAEEMLAALRHGSILKGEEVGQRVLK